jgi:hypothetical protein
MNSNGYYSLKRCAFKISVLCASASPMACGADDLGSSSILRVQALSDDEIEIVHRVDAHLAPGSFGHPLLGIDRNEQGLIPFVDTQDAPSRKRYATMLEVKVDADGRESRFFGSVAVR